MQNIQDLKEKIFFESKNIIDILEKINNVDELLSKQDLVDELSNRISFLRLLEKNIEYFITDNSLQNSENHYEGETQERNREVTEEEAIFNNELNEINENPENIQGDTVINNQLNEIADNEFHENIIIPGEEHPDPQVIENIAKPSDSTEEEVAFNEQMNEIDESELSDYQESALSFIDEERILSNAEPENDEDIHEEMFTDEITEEEAIFNNQMNEIDEFENELSDNPRGVEDYFEDEEKIQFQLEPEVKSEIIPSIFDSETLEEEILIEEYEEQFINSNATIEQGEMITGTSAIEGMPDEMKSEVQTEEKAAKMELSEDIDRRKIVEIDRPLPQTEKERPASDESFENLERYNQEKKIKLANIKGLKAVQTLFDDDPLERNITEENREPIVKEDPGSLLKTNIPTDYMEAEKPKPEFRLDLNDRIAFSKTLFGGSQFELNEVVAELNKFRTLDEAKEYLSDLYYKKNWKKADEYAQRLWMLVENKFL